MDGVIGAFSYAGGSVIVDGNLLQWCLCKINVAVQYTIVSDISYESLGQTLLGQPNAKTI